MCLHEKLLLIVLVICCLLGCKKDLSYSYAFSVNGVACQGNAYSAYYHYDTVAALNEFSADFYIGNVTDTNYVQVSFSGNGYIMPGVYYSGITNPGNTQCSFSYTKNHLYYTDVSGIIEITQIDTTVHKIKGNFQFSAANAGDTAHVTNGSFAGIKYIVQ